MRRENERKNKGSENDSNGAKEGVREEVCYRDSLSFRFRLFYRETYILFQVLGPFS